MRNRRLVDVLACLAIAGCAAGMFFHLRGLPPAPDPEAHEASGWRLAQETVRQLQPGGKVTVIARDLDAFHHPESALQLQAFRKELARNKVGIHATQSLQIDPLKPLEVPPGDFFELIRRAGPGSVIVSFMGPPLLTADQRERLGIVRPRILAFCPGALPQRLDLRVLFDAGLLHGAVISRPPPGRRAPEPRDASGWFERGYQWVTAAEVGQLYRPAEATP